MTFTIDLSNHELIFSNTKLQSLKRKNFIYGKNGTGKSTLCELIREQKSDDFDVRIFQGFESVLGENKKLNAVVLGEENKKIQDQIEKQLNLIQNVTTQHSEKQVVLNSLLGFGDAKKHSVLLSYENVKDDLKEKEKEIGIFYQKAAGELTTQFNLGRSYNRNNFKADISNSKKLSKEEQEKLEEILRQNKKQKILERTYPNLNLEVYLESTNEILQTIVEAKIVFPELENNSSKKLFAEKGLEIHSEGDCCAFCGGEVTKSRIIKLESYFKTDEVLILQRRIIMGISKISAAITELKEIKLLEESQFYSQFSVKELNQQLKDKDSEYIIFLEVCKNHLEEKMQYLFESLNPVEAVLPEDFSAIQKDIDNLIKKNNEFTQNIEQNKQIAKNRLKLHCVAEKCEIGKHERLQWEKKTLENNQNDFKEVLDNEIEKVTKCKQEIDKQIKIGKCEINKLQEKIKNPKIITQNINEKIEKSGKHNLKLKYIESEKYYQVLNSDGSTREISEISTGEKNIISFLYFIESLYSPDLDTGKPKIIILDDPMNSNDDTMQYLIISETEKMYKKNFYDYFILLTHNSHFYLKVTYARRERRDGQNAYVVDNFIRMNNDGNLTTFKYLEDKKEDFVTQYGSLWKELKFLYENDKKDFMCNTIRRIIETYVVFNGVSGNKDAESKMLFNTNSHFAEVGDLETDTNGYTREQIIEFLKQYFKQNSAEKHFNSYWK